MKLQVGVAVQGEVGDQVGEEGQVGEPQVKHFFFNYNFYDACTVHTI